MGKNSAVTRVVKPHSQVDVAELFDETTGYEDDTGIKLAPGLTDEEIQQAQMFYRVFNELMGLCVVFGAPGTGKDTFMNYIAYKLKRYFPYKRIWRDEKPRKLFGEYTGIFNDKVLVDDLSRMREVAKGVAIKDYDGAIEKAADDWVTSQGQVMLKNSVLCLTEFWKYVYNREGQSPMNKTMGSLAKMKRHLDILILGTVQQESDLDRKTCKPFIDWRVSSFRDRNTNPMLEKSTNFTFFIQKVVYDKRKDILLPIGLPSSIGVDAGKPRTYMGDGKIVVKNHNYAPETEEERVVLEVLKAGFNNFESVCDVLYTQGDMEEHEVLDTLKGLCFGKDQFGRYKHAVAYPNYFATFNSRSAPNIKTSIRCDD